MSKKNSASLAQKWKQFKKGEAERPVVHKQALLEVKQTDNMYKVILSEETIDRDGEIVRVSGMVIAENGVVFIDGHNSNGSVVDNRLGTVKNIKIVDNKIVGDIKLVDTLRGREAKAIMDDPDHIFPVSMGFGVMDYNPETKEINQWELFELSAVNIPANPKARVLKEYSKVKEKDLVQVEKELSHYKSIKPVYKEFLKLFLSDTFCDQLGYKKQGELIVDISNIHDVILDKLSATVETPQAKKTSTKLTKKLSEDQLNELINQIVQKIV